MCPTCINTTVVVFCSAHKEGRWGRKWIMVLLVVFSKCEGSPTSHFIPRLLQRKTLTTIPRSTYDTAAAVPAVKYSWLS